MDEFSFLIKYKDIHDLSGEYRMRLDALMEGVEKMKEKINAFINDSSYKGEGADSIKAYFKERHIPMLDGIKEAAQSLLDNIACYKNAYFYVDDSTNFVLNQESIEKYNSVLYSKYTDETNGYFESAKKALSGVDDLYYGYTYPQEYENNIGENHEAYKKTMDNLVENVQTVEAGTKESVEEYTDAFINAIKLTNQTIGVDWNQIQKYQPGDLDDNIFFYSLKQITTLYNDAHEQNAEYFDNIWEYEEYLNTVASQRETQGVLRVIGGIGLVIVGAACIYFTAGAATPIFIAGLTAGTGSAAFGFADIGEGSRDIYYGSMGDVSTIAGNPIKSMIKSLGGTEEDYYKIEQAFAFAASCMIPIGAASQIGNLTFRSGAVAVGKVAVSMKTGQLTSEWTYAKTQNPVLSMFAGMTASSVTAHGMNAIDMRLDLSGLGYSRFMSPQEAARYNQYWKDVQNGNSGHPGMSNLDYAKWMYANQRLSEIQAMEKVNPDELLALRAQNGQAGISNTLPSLSVGTEDLLALRAKLGVPETDTVAVGKTNVPGLENKVFEGESPKVRQQAGLPDLDDYWPNRNIKYPGDNPLFSRHAEEVIANQFDKAVIDAGIDPMDVEGVLKIHQSNPTGVCRKCYQGLNNNLVSPGVLKQLSLKYPNLRIEITSETVPGVAVTGRSTIIIQNGVIIP